MAKIITFFILVLFSLAARSEIQFSGKSALPLKPEFSYLHDPSGKLSYEDIRNRQFSSEQLGGFFPGKVWAKADICYNGNEKLYFIYKDPIDAIDIYVGGSTSPIKHRFLEKKGLAEHFWVKMELPIQGCQKVYVMFKSGDVMNLGAILMDTKILRQEESKYISFYAIFYSFLIIIFFISLLFFFKFKTKLYFYFCALIVTQDILGASLLNGFLFHFVMSPANFVKYDLGNIFAPLMNASLVAFAMAFLEDKSKINRFVSKVFISVQLIVVAPILLSFIWPIHQQNYLTSQIVNYSILFSCFWVLFLAVRNFKSENGKLFLVASGCKVFGQFAKTLLLQGDLPANIHIFSHDMSFFVFNIAALGSMIEGVVIVGLLISSYFKDIEEKNAELQIMMEQLKKSKLDSAIVKVSSQVAHDIRSPLAALDMALTDLNQLPEKKRLLIGQATQRIHDIANNLLSRKVEIEKSEKGLSPEVKTEMSPQLVSGIVESIVSEKRVQFRSRTGLEIVTQLSAKTFGAFSKVNAAELGRVISNLVNNSEEAIQKSGKIAVGLKLHDRDHLCIYVEDDGQGIPNSILERLGEKGVTYGKSGSQSGSGLGVYHAKSTVEKWGGRLEIESVVDKGTVFSLILPLAPPPAWFAPQIKLTPDSKVVVLDDDSSIHQIWDERFEKVYGKPLVHFQNPEELRRWFTANKNENILFLCDYQLLGYEENGLDIIEDLGMEKQSILVTSHSDKSIRIRCQVLGVKSIPKSLANHVPIRFGGVKSEKASLELASGLSVEPISF